MKIYFEEGQAVSQEILDTMMKAAEYCTEAEQLDTDRCEISVTFVSLEEIHELNREYRQVDSPTDVLSFPQFDDLEDLPEEGEIMLGDVVICTDRAKEQAEEFGHSFEREIIYLFVHSVLHLLGYDHMEENEKRIMRRREEAVMEQIGLTRDGAGREAGEEAGQEEEIDYKALYAQAVEMLPRAYAPFSKFKVGAALLGKDGRIYTGVNVENSSFGGTICAERTAFVKAISEGCREFRAIAIVSSQGKAWPCGICRQFMKEFCEDDFKIITGDDADSLQMYTMEEILPEGFRL